MHLNFRISPRALLLGVREEFFRPAFMPLNFVTNVLAFVSNVCLKMFRNGYFIISQLYSKTYMFSLLYFTTVHPQTCNRSHIYLF